MATADYVERRLTAAGYRVTRQRFEVPFYREGSPPLLRAGGRRVRPLRTLQFSPGGTASGRVRSAGSGCAPGDFGALRDGEIALVERGGCFFLDKALGAERAGAAAALVVDQQRRPVAASLQRPGVRIPVLALGARAAEEIGLVGSRRYVARLERADRRRIAAYVNLDMVGSPGSEPRVYGGGPVEAALRRRLPRGTDEATLEGSSDHAPFAGAGIPVGGIFTGLDDCYHRRCDTVRNVDRDVAASSARATERALVELAGG